MPISIIVLPGGDPRLASLMDLRYRVLRAPLGMARGSERNAREDECIYVAACEAEQVVGCVVLLPEEAAKEGRLLQMAVDPSRQRQGIGKQLVHALEREALRRELVRIHLHARAPAIPFYQGLGYTVFGDPFTEVGIPHRHMEKKLNPGSRCGA
ncbi:MAG: GNAT family N-acetyltransferase [Planctomycetota bacterium]